MEVMDQVTSEVSLRSAQETLTQEAVTHLNYTNPTARLLRALAELDIVPYRLDHVERYKRKHGKTSMYSYTKVAWWLLASTVVFTSTFMFSLTTKQPFLHHWGWMLIIPSGVSFVGMLLFAAEPSRGTRTVQQWKRCLLSSYPGYVPDHVLQKAVEIQKKVPDARIGVDYLTVNQEYDYDPFLYVRMNNEPRFYVEVWDERDFERKL